MKKILSLFLMITLLFTVAVCGGASSASGDTGGPPPFTAPDTAPNGGEAEGTGQDSILIAYFSWSGNTGILADMIQEVTGGDLFELVTETPYTDDYDAMLDRAQQEQTDDARPALASRIDGWEDYDVIFVGYPIWWGDAPRAVLTFLESYDFEGKTVVPFCTHGSGGFGRSLDSVAASASGAAILEGFEIAGSGVDSAAEAVSDWIDALTLSR